MKKFIDKDTHDYILEVLNENGISLEILKTASNMDMDLVYLFYEKIMNIKDEKKININKDVIVKMLLGVYGNYITTTYFNALGYKVLNEYPIYDDKGKEITKADIAFYDQNNTLNLCEVKATPQIIDNIRNYKDDTEEKYNGKYYFDMDNDIIKYKEIGKKLINQTKKLTSASKNVTVIVFSGCFIDDLIKDKLKSLGVNVKVMAANINELKRNIEVIVDNISRQLIKDDKQRTLYFEIKNAA